MVDVSRYRLWENQHPRTPQGRSRRQWHLQREIVPGPARRNAINPHDSWIAICMVKDPLPCYLRPQLLLHPKNQAMCAGTCSGKAPTVASHWAAAQSLVDASSDSCSPDKLGRPTRVASPTFRICHLARLSPSLSLYLSLSLYFLEDTESDPTGGRGIRYRSTATTRITSLHPRADRAGRPHELGRDRR